MEKWLSVSKVMEKAGLSESTARRYIRNHQRFLKIRKGKRKSYQIHESQLDIIKQIRDWYGEGKGAEDVDELLQDKGIAMTVVVKEDDGEVEQTVGEALAQLQKSVDEQNESIKELKTFNQRLIEELDKRDEQIMKAVKESLESKKEIAAAKEKPADKQPEIKKWWEFWK